MNLKSFKWAPALWRRSGFHYRYWKGIKPPFWLYAGGKHCRVFADDDLGSKTCYVEIAVCDYYHFFSYARAHRPSVIVDIGASFGMFSKMAAFVFPEADIFAYEPDSNAFALLVQNASGTRIRPFACAVFGTAGIQRMDFSWGTTLGKIAEKGATEVACKPPQEIGEGQVIDLLKMDCEGSEWEILRDRSLLERTRNFCMEYHLWEGRRLEELKEIVRGSGHRISSIQPLTPDVGILLSEHD